MVPASLLLALCASASAFRAPTSRRRRRAPALASEVDATASVEVRDTRDGRGLGVFAKSAIKNGTFVVDYAGDVIASEALLERHPDAEPEYAFRVDDLLYLRRADLPPTNRGDAAAATWIFRGY